MHNGVKESLCNPCRNYPPAKCPQTAPHGLIWAMFTKTPASFDDDVEVTTHESETSSKKINLCGEFVTAVSATPWTRIWSCCNATLVVQSPGPKASASGYVPANLPTRNGLSGSCRKRACLSAAPMFRLSPSLKSPTQQRVSHWCRSKSNSKTSFALTRV